MQYCGGTEIGGAFLSGSLLQPQSPSAFSTPALGVNLVLLGPEGQQCPHSGTFTDPSKHGPTPKAPFVGELALVSPILGTSQRLLNKDHFEVYYSEMPNFRGRPLRRHGDEMQRLPGNYYSISSVEIERTVMERLTQELAEAAAVSVPTPGGGPEQLVLYLVLQVKVERSLPDLQRACNEALRVGLNPLFKVAACRVVKALPRTASNKVIRRLLRDQEMAKARL
eukprot:gene28926-32118_t